MKLWRNLENLDQEKLISLTKGINNMTENREPFRQCVMNLTGDFIRDPVLMEVCKLMVEWANNVGRERGGRVFDLEFEFQEKGDDPAELQRCFVTCMRELHPNEYEEFDANSQKSHGELTQLLKDEWEKQ